MGERLREKDDQQVSEESDDCQSDDQMLERGLLAVGEYMVVELPEPQPYEAGMVGVPWMDFFLRSCHIFREVE
jgi:hypothetical protein